MNALFTVCLIFVAHNFRVKLSVLVTLLLSLISLSVHAEHEAVRREVQSGKLKPLVDILHAVQKRHGGRVLDVELERSVDGQRWYEIKIKDGGQRTEIYVDAVTGQEIAKPGSLSSSVLSMAAVVDTVLQTHPGTVLKVELETPDGAAPYYEFQLLGKDGQEVILRVDAMTAKVLAAPPVSREIVTRLMPLQRILEMLEKRYNARSTEAELKLNREQKAYYEVDLKLSSGRSLEVHVDARSGQLIGEDELHR